jgi:hypothetical protein
MKRSCILISLESLGGRIGTLCDQEWSELMKPVNGSPMAQLGQALGGATRFNKLSNKLSNKL